MDKNKGPGYDVVHRGMSHGTQPTGVPDASIYIYGARLAKPRYQVEFKISQLSAFPWLTEN